METEGGRLLNIEMCKTGIEKIESEKTELSVYIKNKIEKVVKDKVKEKIINNYG